MFWGVNGANPTTANTAKVWTIPGKSGNKNPGFGRGGSSEELLPQHWLLYKKDTYLLNVLGIFLFLIAVNC